MNMKSPPKTKTPRTRRPYKKAGVRPMSWQVVGIDPQEPTTRRLGIDHRPRIIFVMKGAVALKWNRSVDRTIRQGEMMVIPAGRTLTLKALDVSRVVTCLLDMEPCCCTLCDADYMVRLLSGPGGLGVVPFGEMIDNMLELLLLYIDEGISEPKLYEIKRSELLFLLYVQVKKITGYETKPCLRLRG